MRGSHSSRSALVVCLSLAVAGAGAAQTGVSDDRVSLPDGPGSLEGLGDNASVNPNLGQLTHAVTIHVPGGFDGLTPELSLDYSSGGGSGVAGMGWDVAVPSIERMTSRGVPNYGEDDLFVGASGEQLTRVNDGEPAEYRSRFEGSFVRYRWHQRASGGEGYWTAELPDGVVAYFGADRTGAVLESARVRGPDGVFRYLLTESVDPWGHYTQYAYSFYGSKPLLDFIGYVHDDDGTPTQSVTFDYEARDDVIGDASGGFNEVLAHRLTQVQVWTGGTNIRTYRLSYAPYEDARHQSQLVKVETLGADGSVHPAVHSFRYSEALGGVCDGADCAAPFLVDMGSLGVSFQSGEATLIDMNGDGLPDVIGTPTGAAHQIFLSELSPDGAHTFAPAVDSALGTSGGHDLRSPYVQTLDHDGDGFADLLSTATGDVLRNDGSGDWAEVVSLGSGASTTLPDFGDDFELGQDTELVHIRFFDYDGDARIDVLRADDVSTSIYRNVGAGGYATDPEVQGLGWGFEADGLELADINGDGLLDPVLLRAGVVSYKLNLGRGRWSAQVDIENAPVDADALSFASLEDLDGDGRDDLVIVEAGTVTYALNRNGTTFDEVVSVSQAGGAALPIRDASSTVLFADMNANGSNDVVWIDASGNVQYLELFPVRPSLLTRIENGLGGINEISYGTAVSHRARAADDWAHPLPMPLVVVDSLDAWAETSDPALTVHDLQVFDYADGYFDGIERSFQGFGTVTLAQPGDDNQEASTVVMRHHVGAAGTPHLAGRVYERSVTSSGEPLRLARTTWETCDVAGVDNTGQLFPVVFACQTRLETVHQERAPDDEWVTVATDFGYDGYGNQVSRVEHGVVDVGGDGCSACSLDDEAYGEPCGAQCTGDEMLFETTFAAPADNASGRWLLRLKVEEQRRGSVEGRLQVTRSYYDGEAFVGLPLGEADKGSLIRVTRLDDEDDEVPIGRHRVDDDGNLVEALSALGTHDGDGHRRAWAFDRLGLDIVRSEVVTDGRGDDARRLVRDYTYDPLWGEMASATPWYLDGEASPGSARFGYDAHGRRVWRANPGDTTEAPTNEYEWDLGAPYSRIITRTRSVRGGALDLEDVSCVDGLGTEIQRRSKRTDGEHLVNGFGTYNSRGALIRSYEPYVSSSAECEDSEPTTPYEEYFYDGLGREAGSLLADAADRGTPSETRITYGPLAVTRWDERDTDDDDDAAGTPDVLRYDGLRRPVSAVRATADGEGLSRYRFSYDDLGELRGFVDPAGNEKRQLRDRLGRVIEVDDPDAGRWAYAYDAEDNPVRVEGPDGSVVLREYDDVGRPVAEWEESDREGTLVEHFYDAHPDCAAIACANTAGRVAGSRFPSERYGSIDESYSYDVRGNLIGSSRSYGGFSLRSESEYDNADRLVATLFPDERRLALELDGLGNLKAIPGYLDEVRYNERGFLSGYRLSNGVDTEVEYDERNELRALRAAGVVDLELERDRGGNVTALFDGVNQGAASLAGAFDYDALSRLVGADVADGDARETLTWSYDELDRVTEKRSSKADSPAHVGAFAYDGGAPRAVTSAGGVGFALDAAGRVTSRGDDTYRWDLLGRLVGVERAGARLTHYEHAGAGGRAVEVTGAAVRLRLGDSFELNDGVGRLRVLIDGVAVLEEDSPALAARALGDEDGDDAITAADAWLSGGDKRQKLRAAARSLLVAEGGARRYRHLDHQGSTVALTDDDGAVTERFAYYPYGEVRHSSAVETESAAFQGKRSDESGLIDFGARQLSPREGRFLSPDPTFLMVGGGVVAQGPNALSGYAFAGNSPVTLTDLNGQLSWKKGALYGVGATLLAGAVAAGIVTGVLPALGAAAIAAVAAGSVFNFVGAAIGGVASGVGEALNNRTRLKLKYPNGNVPMSEKVLSSVYVTGRALGGAVSGFFSFGTSAISSLASDTITVRTYEGKVSPAKGALAKILIGAAGGMVSGGVDLLASTVAGNLTSFSSDVTDLAMAGAQAAASSAVIEGAYLNFFTQEQRAIKEAQKDGSLKRQRNGAFDVDAPSGGSDRVKKKLKKKKKRGGKGFSLKRLFKRKG